MSEVQVTFTIEGDDDSHPTGMSQEQFDELNDTLAQLGAMDINTAKVVSKADAG